MSDGKMKRLFVLALLLGVAGCATASTEQGGWRAVTSKDVAGSPDFESRKTRPDLHLSALGDFDGDGRPDRAELRINRAAGRYGLFVLFAGKAEPALQIADGPLTELPHRGVLAVPPGRYLAACAKGSGEYSGSGGADCSAQVVEIKTDGIDLLTFAGSADLYYWKQGAFAHEWMSK